MYSVRPLAVGGAGMHVDLTFIWFGVSVAMAISSEQTDSLQPSQQRGRSPSDSQSNPVMDRVDLLRRQLAGLVAFDAEQKNTISWGCLELDAWMPGGALQPGMIVELLYQKRGSGAGSLAMHGAKQAVSRLQAPFVVVDRGERFYPPAAVARGIESRDLIVVRPPAVSSGSGRRAGMSAAEELWALDQALRCPGIAVVMAWMDKIDPNAYRRLQLAAEAGQTLALLIRPERVQAYPTWADVQLLISPRSAHPQIAGASSVRERQDGGETVRVEADCSEKRFLQATLLRQRGRAGNHTIEGSRLNLEIDEQQRTLQICAGTVRNEARIMHMAPRVAHPATRRRSAGA